MLQREEDEAHNMYNNRVNLGVEKPNDRYTRRKNRRSNNEVTTFENSRAAECVENIPQAVQKPSMNKIQLRSLPRTPDYAQSFKADDNEIIMARSKEGQKLRDFGYEFISGGDDVNNFKTHFNNSNGINNNTNTIQRALKPMVLAKPSDRFILPTKKKGLNWMGLNLDSKRNEDDKIIGKGSFKMIKQKHLEYGGDINHRAKTSESVNCTNGDRKGSITSIKLPKLTFPTKTVKEKRLLGSPRLHRAASSIFGRKNIESPTYEQQSCSVSTFPLDTQSFVDNDQNNGYPNANTASSILLSHGGDTNSLNEIDGAVSTAISSTDQNIQYPPIFVPEVYMVPERTYSFRDPNSTH